MRLVIIAMVLALGGLGAIALRPRVARAAMLPVGAPAPAFQSQVISGDQAAPVSLGDFRGRKLILYFYPKDDTPGCTREACAFRDGYARFQAAGISVLGCSTDSAESHKAFIRKYGLPFPLLLDPDHKIARAYGADNGIPILGLDRRVTYVIGEDGRILKVYAAVDPAVHARQILHDLGADHPPTPTPAAPVPSPTAAAPAARTGAHPNARARVPEEGPEEEEEQGGESGMEVRPEPGASEPGKGGKGGEGEWEREQRPQRPGRRDIE
ncbi:MAG TPA: peroxiredoxin [Candidatus Binataceae bacterium]|nr:peroxiredoxin [Candidatus Binataceae bacterium]